MKNVPNYFHRSRENAALFYEGCNPKDDIRIATAYACGRWERYYVYRMHATDAAQGCHEPRASRWQWERPVASNKCSWFKCTDSDGGSIKLVRSRNTKRTRSFTGSGNWETSAEVKRRKTLQPRAGYWNQWVVVTCVYRRVVFVSFHNNSLRVYTQVCEKIRIEKLREITYVWCYIVQVTRILIRNVNLPDWREYNIILSCVSRLSLFGNNNILGSLRSNIWKTRI